MPTPSIQTLVTDAQQVLNLDSISAVRSVVAVALANANTGTPLNPNLTTQQLWNEFYQVVTKPKSDIESIIANQLMKFLFAPPAPGGVGANGQVIFNNNGVLAGDNELFYNATTNTLTTEKLIVPGNTQLATVGTLYVGTILNPKLKVDVAGTGVTTITEATITGDLTVDTSTLKVDSANNRVGIGTAAPGKRCEINQSANAITTIGEGEILRLIGDDGNTNGRITEIGFGSGPTGAVYAPVTLGAINTSVSGYGHKAFYIATRTGAADVAPIERYRIANDGVATWSNVGGVAGTAMTLNSTGLGLGVVPSLEKLQVNGGIVLSPPATPATLTTNGQLTVNATSNTNLRFSYRGSDGVTRVANIALT